LVRHQAQSQSTTDALDAIKVEPHASRE
jgi:hypothetical protein